MFAEFFFPHQVQVKDRTAAGGTGPRHGGPRTLRAEVLDKTELVRNTAGQEVVSSARVTVPLDAAVAVGALVTVWAGTPAQHESEVLAVSRDENAPPLPSHLILSLK